MTTEKKRRAVAVAKGGGWVTVLLTLFLQYQETQSATARAEEAKARAADAYMYLDWKVDQCRAELDRFAGDFDRHRRRSRADAPTEDPEPTGDLTIGPVVVPKRAIERAGEELAKPPRVRDAQRRVEQLVR